MRALRLIADRKLELADVPDPPPPGDGEVQIRIKAVALNHGLSRVTEEFFVGIDADTMIDPKAIRFLVRHFQVENVAAVAGRRRIRHVGKFELAVGDEL